jgi:TonB dependent receptor/CarboxypepD_reg-like domain/TonB-dependent Receptor Plug Domain
MKTRIILIFSILLGINAMAYSQYILKGVVKDYETKEILPGASVVSDAGIKPQLTDGSGKFSITSTKSTIAIAVNYVGYKSQTTKVDIAKTKQEIEILLRKDDNQLNEVIINSSGGMQELNRPLLGVNTLNIKTINKLPTALGETDILKGLQMLPGVSSVGEASNGLNIRGGTTDQNLILLDNAPIFNPSHMFGLFSAFPSDGISNLQLYKGNIPSKFGGRSASVLDISLKNPSLTKFKMDGGISLVSEKISVDIPIIKDKMGLMIAGRASFNDFILPIISPKFQEMKSNFGDVAAKLFYKINDKNTLSLSNYQSYDFFQTELLGTVSNVNASATQFRYKTNNITAKWNTSIGSKGFLETIFVNSDYQPDILLPEIASENKVVVSQGINYKQAKTAYRYVLTKHTIETGLDVIKYSINPGRLNPNESTSVTAKNTQKEFGLESGAYISDEIEIGQKMQLSAGLRYSLFHNLGPNDVRTYQENLPKTELSVVSVQPFEKNQVTKSYGGLEPRFGLKYMLTPQTNLKFGYNISRQYLQQISNTTTPLPTSRWKLADTHIRPQVSQLITGGISTDLKQKTYQIGIEAYYRNTNDVIDYKSGADFFLKNYPETELLQGFNRSYGIEFMASKEKGFTTGWINYTYSRSLNKVSEGNTLDQQINKGNFYAANYDRPHTFNASIVIGQGLHHDFSFNFTYSTGRPFTSPQGYVQYNNNLFPYYSDRNNQRIPAYHRLDFAWNIYNPKMDPNRRFKGNWAFSVYNLYGAKNAYSIFYRAENRVLNPYKLIIFGSPIPSLAYKFTVE